MARLYRMESERVVCCSACDRVFRSYDARAMYCSPACKQAAYRLRRRRRRRRAVR